MKFIKNHNLVFSLCCLILFTSIKSHGENSKKGGGGYKINEKLQNEGYAHLYSIRFDTSENSEEEYDYKNSDDEENEESMKGQILIYADEAQLKENKKPTKFVFELDSNDVSPFMSENSTVLKTNFSETSKELEIKNDKNMFTVVETKKDVYSMKIEKIQTDCLHLIYFSNTTGEIPKTKIESNMIYMEMPEEKQTLRRETTSRRGKDDKKYKSEGKDFLQHSVLDSSVVQYMVYFCPFWKSQTEQSYSYKLSLELMTDLPYFYGIVDLPCG